MANIVSDIITQLKAQVATTIPSRAESRYIWSLENNAYKNNSGIFCIRPAGANSVSGTNRTITIDQGFELILSTEFKNKGDNDAALDAAILDLYEDHEAVYKVWFQRNLSISRVLVIDSIELSEPEVDNNNNTVSITARFNVKYRTEA